MPSRKLDDEELLKTLENQDFNPNTKSDVELFLEKYNITPGQNYVSKSRLYQFYCKFSKNPLTAALFNRYLLKFDSTKDFIYVNKNAIASEIFLLLKQPSNVNTEYRRYKHLQNFLKKHNIKKGTYWIMLDVLFHVYDKWSYKIHKKNPLPFRTFSALLSLHFDKMYTRERTTHFRINDTIFNYITKEEIEEITKGKMHAKEAKKAKGKKNNKS